MDYREYRKKKIPEFYAGKIEKALINDDLDEALMMFQCLGDIHADSEYFDKEQNIIEVVELFFGHLKQEYKKMRFAAVSHKFNLALKEHGKKTYAQAFESKPNKTDLTSSEIHRITTEYVSDKEVDTEKDN
jgi:hypothetical protein